MNKKAGVITALWFLALVNYLDRVAMSFAGPSIMKSLSMSPAAFGIVLSSFSIGYLIAQVPGGLLADKWGARALLVIGPIFWAVFTGMTGLVATLAGFVAVRICFGLSEGMSNTSLYKIVGEHFDAKERSKTLAICSTAIPLAPAFAGALVGKLIGLYGWQTMFFFMAALALLASSINYILLPKNRPEFDQVQRIPPAEEKVPFRRVLNHPSLRILSLAAFAWNIAYWGYLGWMPSYLTLGHHIDLKSLGLIGGIPYVFAFFGLLIGGWLGTMLHRHCPQLVASFFFLGGAFLFLAYQADTLPLSLAGLSGAAFSLFATSGPIGKIALDLAPDRYRAAYIGVYNTAGQAGGVVAPAVIGYIVSATGTFAGGFGFMIAALCVAATCFLVLIPHLPQKLLPRVALI